MRTKFWSENVNGRSIGVDGRIILKWIFREIVWEGVEWMRLAQDRDQWQALVNTVMNLWVS
jgi:hypothetical protein